MVLEEEKDRLARRQARAAVALIRMGRGAEAWPLLRQSPDPRVRSFILNGLEPLGVEPKAIADELVRLDECRPRGDTSARGIPRPSSSIARPRPDGRSILALGTVRRPMACSPGEKEALTARLFALYRLDPDAGIHGAAEWTLRRWNSAIGSSPSTSS